MTSTSRPTGLPTMQDPSTDNSLSSRVTSFSSHEARRDPSPTSTLRNLLSNPNPDQAPNKDIELVHQSFQSASPSDKAFATNVLESSLALRSWSGELEKWEWKGQFDRSEEAASRDPISVAGPSKDGHNSFDDNIASPNFVTEDNSSIDLSAYQDRLSRLVADFTNIDIEHMKSVALGSYLSNQESDITKFQPHALDSTYQANNVGNFTALVAVVLLQALPHYSDVSTSIDSWTARVAVSKVVPKFKAFLGEARGSLSEAWATIGISRTQDSVLPQAKLPVDERDIEQIQMILQTRVSAVGQTLDSMLDLIEGLPDSLPDSWIDEVEWLEEEYSEWTVAAQRVLLQWKEQIELENAERERIEREKAEREQAEQEKAEQEKEERELAEQEKAERELAEQEKAERELAKREKAEREQVEREKVEQIKAQQELAENEKLEKENAERERAGQKIAEKERAAQVRAEQGNAQRENLESENDEQLRTEKDKSDVNQNQHRTYQDLFLSQPESLPKSNATTTGHEHAFLVDSSEDYENNSTRELNGSQITDHLLHEDDQKSPTESYLVDQVTNDSPVDYIDPHMTSGGVLATEATLFAGDPILTYDEHQTVPNDTGASPDEPSNSSLPSPLNDPERLTIGGDANLKDDEPSPVEEEYSFLDSTSESPSPIERSPQDVMNLPTTPQSSSIGRNVQEVPLSTDEQIERQIDSILTNLPARFKLKKRDHESPQPSSDRPTSPLLTLAPAETKETRAAKFSGDSPIRLYYLSQEGRQQPIKLFVRLVGEHGERVMVRVGGGWADLAQYLRDYATHHSRTIVPAPNQELQALDLRQPSNSRIFSLPGTTRDHRSASPTQFDFSNEGSPRQSPRQSPDSQRTAKIPNSSFQVLKNRPTMKPLNVGANTVDVAQSIEFPTTGEQGPTQQTLNTNVPSQSWLDESESPVALANQQKNLKVGKHFTHTLSGSSQTSNHLEDLGTVGSTRRVFRVSEGTMKGE